MGLFDKSSATTKKMAAEAKHVAAINLKYPKPKILLIDLPVSAEEALKANGFNVSLGTFGKPYKVQKSSQYQQVIGSGTLPNYTEQEIVVVDIKLGEIASAPDGEPHVPREERDIWAKCDHGYIDPRPRAANFAKDVFNRTYSAGGVFVVFADAKTGIEMQIAHYDRNFGLSLDHEFPDVWSLFPS
jgi:hypothetical protein